MTERRYVLALDQGTTSSRALVIDEGGGVMATAQRSFAQIFPEPGWVEHDPIEIWSTQIGVAAEALAHAGLDAADIAAVGIVNQRETTLVWDRRTGEPVYNAIVWQDRRTAEFCERLRSDGQEGMIQARTGLLADAYFSASSCAGFSTMLTGFGRVRSEGSFALGPWTAG